jgi:K+-sensing histidine kinase KdpD
VRVEPDYKFRLRPWSLPAFLVALLAVAAATGIRMMLASLGLHCYFATFFPAILAAGLIAGAPAGAFTAVIAIPIVWWAFMPPVFEFSPLGPADYDQFALFLLFSSLLVGLSHLYREALATRRRLEFSERLEREGRRALTAPRGGYMF